MSLTIADKLSREIEAVAQDVFRIQALSRTQPHVFAEQKDEAAKRLRKIAADVRNTFGGPQAPFTPGTITSARGKTIRVERRRRAA